MAVETIEAVSEAQLSSLQMLPLVILTCRLPFLAFVGPSLRLWMHPRSAFAGAPERPPGRTVSVFLLSCGQQRI